jgi:hypothetical protein
MVKEKYFQHNSLIRWHMFINIDTSMLYSSFNIHYWRSSLSFHIKTLPLHPELWHTRYPKTAHFYL